MRWPKLRGNGPFVHFIGPNVITETYTAFWFAARGFDVYAPVQVLLELNYGEAGNSLIDALHHLRPLP